jgi:hypothetical protein
MAADDVAERRLLSVTGLQSIEGRLAVCRLFFVS